MDAERIVEPQMAAEHKLLDCLQARSLEVFSQLEETDRAVAFGTMIVVYDSVGLGYSRNRGGISLQYPGIRSAVS